MARERLGSCTEEGMSVLVGTVDAEGMPSCCRAVALTTKDNFETITVYLPAATSQEALANVATTRRMAIVCTEPLSHESVQIKGVTRAVRYSPPSERDFIEKRLEAYADVLQQVGLPRRVTRSVAHWPAFAVDVTVEEVFDQTPGPKAGTQLT